MKKEDFPLVSIIVPNWNGKNDVFECLYSMRNQEYPKDKLEIIIIDNGSTDGSQKEIKHTIAKMQKEKWVHLELIENKANLGSSIARNQGIKASYKKSKYIWMLDNDIVADPNALKELVEFGEKYREIGILGSVNYYYNNPEETYYLGSMLNWKTWLFRHICEKELANSDAYFVDCVATSSLLIKKEIINEIGMLDPEYFCYFNDVDWCLRAKKSGYKICILRNSKIWHKVSHSTNKIPGFKIYYTIRNTIRLIKKNAPRKKYIIFLLYLFIYFLPRNLVLLMLQKNISILSSLLKGLRDGLNQKI